MMVRYRPFGFKVTVTVSDSLWIDDMRNGHSTCKLDKDNDKKNQHINFNKSCDYWIKKTNLSIYKV